MRSFTSHYLMSLQRNTKEVNRIVGEGDAMLQRGQGAVTHAVTKSVKAADAGNIVGRNDEMADSSSSTRYYIEMFKDFAGFNNGADRYRVLARSSKFLFSQFGRRSFVT
jgi:hypothetical protein